MESTFAATNGASNRFKAAVSTLPLGSEGVIGKADRPFREMVMMVLWVRAVVFVGGVGQRGNVDPCPGYGDDRVRSVYLTLLAVAARGIFRLQPAQVCCGNEPSTVSAENAGLKVWQC